MNDVYVSRKWGPVVFQAYAGEPVDGGSANNRGRCGRIGGRVHVHVTPAARNARAQCNAVVLEEHELRAPADKPALVGFLEADAHIVGLGRLRYLFLECDVLDVEAVLEPEEGEQVDVEPFLDGIGSGKHGV